MERPARAGGRSTGDGGEGSGVPEPPDSFAVVRLLWRHPLT